jgi:uncharacterized protein (TIGR04141 family)
MDKENAELGQISFYLAKQDQTFDTIIDPEAAITAQVAYQAHDFEVGPAACRFLYFEHVSKKSNPPWLDFANEQISPGALVAFSATSRSPNGLILIRLDGRVLAAAFGRSASSCLLSRALEPDFGIRTAMNLCGNEEIRQTKSQSNTITPTQIDRQVAKPADAFAFGLNEAEDLRYISAHLKGDRKVTLQGRNSLTVKVIGEDKLNWDKIITQCRSFLEAFGSQDFAALFPNYKNFRLANEEQAATLDAALIEVLQARHFHRLNMGLPEFVSEEEYGFSYSNHAKRDDIIYAFLDPAQLQYCLPLDNVTIDQLKHRKIFAYSPVENRVLTWKKWYVYDCLSFEHELDGDYFILSDGRWLKVDVDFYKAIEAFTKALRVEPCEAVYAGIDISNPQAMRNEERIFNDQVCALRPSNVKFDRAKLKIGTGRRDKEFCDILDLEDDGVIRIVNCKPWKDAASINYLFSQAKFYCESFLRDETFLADIREHIANSSSSRKDEYLAIISKRIEDLKGQDYRVCLWLLYDQREAAPNPSDIPFIARYELKLMHEHLRKVCKFRDIIVRFVPVQLTNFRTVKSPIRVK